MDKTYYRFRSRSRRKVHLPPNIVPRTPIARNLVASAIKGSSASTTRSALSPTSIPTLPFDVDDLHATSFEMHCSGCHATPLSSSPLAVRDTATAIASQLFVENSGAESQLRFGSKVFDEGKEQRQGRLRIDWCYGSIGSHLQLDSSFHERSESVSSFSSSGPELCCQLPIIDKVTWLNRGNEI